MFEVTINIPGLKELAEAIMGISAGKNGAPVQGAAQSQQLPVQQAPAAQQIAPPVQPIPVVQPTPVVQQTPAVQPTPVAQQTPVQVVPVTPQSVPPVQNTVPTSTPSYVLDDLARAAMTLMDTGRQAELQALLAAFSVNSLPELQPERYGAFATALREKGAQI